MSQPLRICLTILLAVLCLMAEARIIVFVLDDSGSMKGDKFRAAVYGVQLALACMGENDKLYIVKNRRAVQLTRNQSVLSQIERYDMDGVGDFSLLKPVVEDIPYSTNDDINIIIVGDGIWFDNLGPISSSNSSSDLAKWDNFYNTYKPEIYVISFHSDEIPDVNERTFVTSPFLGPFVNIKERG